MGGILQGMRVIESSAFVAVPLAGMTLAQMGADVIRVDRLQGGLDARRWPVTADGQSLFWAGLNKGKRSLAVDLAHPEGQEIVAALATAPGPDAGLLPDQPARQGAAGLSGACRAAGGPDHGLADRHAAGRTGGGLHGEPRARLSGGDGAGGIGPIRSPMSCPPGTASRGRWSCRPCLRPSGTGCGPEQGQLAELALKDVAAAMLGHLGIVGEVLVNGVDRPEVRQRALRGLWAGFRDPRRAAGHGDRADRAAMEGAGPGAGTGGRGRGAGGAAGARSGRRGQPVPGAQGDHRALRALVRGARLWPRSRRLFDKAGLTWAPFRSFARGGAGGPRPVRREPDDQGAGAAGDRDAIRCRAAR